MRMTERVAYATNVNSLGRRQLQAIYQGDNLWTVDVIDLPDHFEHMLPGLLSAEEYIDAMLSNMIVWQFMKGYGQSVPMAYHRMCGAIEARDRILTEYLV